MSHRVIDGDPSFPVRPGDIDTGLSLHWSFPDLIDGPESHQVAKEVIEFCQQAGGWTSFTIAEIPCLAGGGGLTDPGYVWKSGEAVPITRGWIVLGEDGRFRVTSDFIFRCYGRAGRRGR